MSINIGRYNQRITIFGYSDSQSSSGFVERSYSELYTRWAQVELKGGTESEQADERVASRTAIFKIRQQGTTINEAMQIGWNNQRFDIVSIDEFGINLKDGYEILAVSKDSTT